MRDLEVIENELEAAREALSNVKGTPAEVYSRIVGYYRSVRNWNKGKREEYGQRVMFQPDTSLLASCAPVEFSTSDTVSNTVAEEVITEERLLLFVRPACPACPSAKAAASRLGLPMELYDADTDEGLAEAVRRQVLSTPTAILLSANGEELGRARDAKTIEKLLEAAIAV
ncbi:MAG: thiol reductase thioredoxin [Treponema sp.]|nr:thiol reductase thioredoxin [Treponema sp.]